MQLQHFLSWNKANIKHSCKCLILHQLNTKPNTIKSHKIQGIKLMQLQHFLSWNKANIKHSCKSLHYRSYPQPHALDD